MTEVEIGLAFHLLIPWEPHRIEDIKASNSPFTCGNATEVEEDCFEGSTSSVPVVIFFVTQFFMGVGSSGYFTLGMAYLDDNTRKDKAPILLAISQCIRMVGPTIGFSMGSYALSQYVDPLLHPIIDNKDPRWIGAWWMGWVPHSIIGLILGTLITLFPKELPRTAQRKAEQALRSVGKEITTQVNRMSFKDFKITIGRLLRNKTLILNNLSSVFFILGYTGHWVFMPKYMETQYRQSASRASFISGSVGIIFMGLGLATSAVVISKFKPRARYLAAWCVFVEMIDVIGHFSWVFLSCNSQDLAGDLSEDGTWNLTTPCNTHCDCGPTVKYSPICAQDGGTTFYSPCHAGCTITDFINGTKMYSNCSCIPGGQAFDGPCPVDCYTNFTIFIVSQCIMRFLRSSGKAGNTLILFRCVDEEDKAFSISLSEFLLCGLALIPGPILYGLLLDWACIVWGQTCDNSGNCWLYDGQTQRYLLNFTAAGLLACGMLLDIGVWYLVNDLKIYDDEHIEKKPEVSADEERLPVSPL